MCCEDHAAGAVDDAVIGLCGEVVEELVHIRVGEFCGGSLFGANVAEGDQ